MYLVFQVLASLVSCDTLYPEEYPYVLDNSYWDDFNWSKTDFIDDEVHEKFEEDWQRAYAEYTLIDEDTPPGLKSERTIRYEILDAIRYNSEYNFYSEYTKYFMKDSKVFYKEEDKVFHNPLKDIARYYDNLIEKHGGKNTNLKKGPEIYDMRKYPNQLDDVVDDGPVNSGILEFYEGTDYGLRNDDVEVIHS